MPTAANISWDLSDQYQTVDVSQVGTTVILNITSGRGLTKTYVLAFMVEIPNQYTVTLLSNNDNWGTVIGGNTYNANSQVGIGAIAKEGYQFYHWNNTISENPHTFTLTQDTSFVVMFLPNTEEGVVSDVTSNSVHMEWEVKPWGNHGYWVWIYADKDHKQWYCKMRFYANGVLDKFYWGLASKHYGKENSNQAAPRHFYRSPARYLEASVAIAYDLTDLDAAQDYFYTIEGVDEKEEVVSVMAGKFTTGAQTPTSIEDVTENEDQFETVVKLIRDGQIYILCGDNIYTLQGQEVK